MKKESKQISPKIIFLIPIFSIIGAIVGIIISACGFRSFNYNIPFFTITGIAIGFAIVAAVCTEGVTKC